MWLEGLWTSQVFVFFPGTSFVIVERSWFLFSAGGAVLIHPSAPSVPTQSTVNVNSSVFVQSKPIVVFLESPNMANRPSNLFRDHIFSIITLEVVLFDLSCPIELLLIAPCLFLVIIHKAGLFPDL